jgi:hypothetical protein
MMMTWRSSTCTGLVALALAACSDDDNGSAATTGFPAGPTSGTTTSAGGHGGSGGAMAGGGGSGGVMTTSSGGSGGGGDGGGGTGGGFGPLDASLVSNDLVVECQAPDVDPVEGSFTAAYDNSGGSVDGMATVLSARVVFTGSNSEMLTWAFGIDPLDSGVVAAGDSIQVVHGKLVDMGGGQGMGPPCIYCNGGNWTLEVAWDIAGQMELGSLGPSPVPCN